MAVEGKSSPRDDFNRIVTISHVTSSEKPIIGLAGGIGAGKSSVAQMLADLGCVVSDSDVAAREALRDPQIKKTVFGWWGRDIMDAQGEIVRSKLAGIVFKDSQARRKLEGLTHPWIEKRRLELFAKAPVTAPALVIDAPLLFEAGLDNICDVVIFIDADRDVRRSRIAGSRGWTDEELGLREQSQLPLDLKRQRADHILQNNGDLTELCQQVRRVLDTIVQSNRP
jgi:dephospho-CoA kinase